MMAPGGWTEHRRGGWSLSLFGPCYPHTSGHGILVQVNHHGLLLSFLGYVRVSESIDLAAITTNVEFGRALTSVRLRARLSIRAVAQRVRIPASTAGGYFSGAHLPGLQPADLLTDMLRACGVSDEAELEQWTATWMRLRRARPADEEHSADPRPDGGSVRDSRDSRDNRDYRDEGEGTGAGEFAATITVAPPVARLNRIGTLFGREDILTRLSTHLPAAAGDPADAGHGGVHVLYGMGGIGKSTVALALADRARRRAIRTWWIGVTTAATVPAAMAALAVELGATRHELRNASLPDLVWRYLRALDEPWLLVIDNVDDPAAQLALPGGELLDGSGWLRRLDDTRGMVVVTTRDRSAWPAEAGPHEDDSPDSPDGRWVTLHPVRVLADEDAGAALRTLAGPGAGSTAEARTLGRRLGGLPLALGFAGRFLARTARMPAHFGDQEVPRTYLAYEQVLRAGGAGPVLPDFDGTSPALDGASLRTTGRDRERALVGPTWELSLQVLTDQGRPAARPLLTLLACFGCDLIPLELLDPATLSTGPLLGKLGPTQVWDLLDALAGQGLIELVPSPPPSTTTPVRPVRPSDNGSSAAAAPVSDATPAQWQIWLHPLVQDSFRRHAVYGERPEDYLEAVTALLARATRFDPRDPEHWAWWARLRAHWDAALGLLADIPDAVRAGLRLPPELLVAATRGGRFLRATGYPTQAVATYETVLAMGRPSLGAEHADVLAAEHDLYRVMAALGRQADAEPGFRRVLDARVRLLGASHADTLTTQHYLARTLRELGHFTEALELLKLTLERRVPTLGATHRDTLTTRNNIGDVLAELGQLDEAQEMLHAVWAARGDILGPTHPATLVTLAHLTRLALRSGAAQRAADHAQALVTTCQEVLGPDHPRALAAVGLYGEVERRRGRLAPAARAGYLAAHQRSLRVLGPQHATTATLAGLATAEAS